MHHAVGSGRRFDSVFLTTARLAVIPSLIVMAKIFLPLDGWYDRFHYVVGRDFSNFWMAGHLAVTDRAGLIYDLDAYWQAMRFAFSPQQPEMNFSYPPHALPLLLPLGMMPFGVALAVWLAAGVAAVHFAAFGRSEIENSKTWTMLLLLSPCVLFTFSIAQATCLLAFLFVTGLRLVKTRPWLSGLLLGLLSIKPHLGLLIGAWLLMGREWKVIAAALATALALSAMSVILFGTGPWTDYLAHTVPYQASVLRVPYGFVWALMVSPYAWFSQIGVSAGVATVLHAATALALAIASLVCATTARGNNEDLAIAILALGSVLITPYSLIYDLVIPVAALFGFLAKARIAASRWPSYALAAFWAAPIALMALNERHVPLSLPVTLAAFAATCGLAVRRRAATTSSSASMLTAMPFAANRTTPHDATM